jgi:hypothetical protein
MHFGVLAKVDWATGSLCNLALLYVMVVRGRWREFPVLTIWLSFITARTLLLVAAYADNSLYWYAQVYWPSLWIDFALQLGVVFEIARIVLRPTGTWVHDARGRFAATALAGIGAAALMAWWVTPPMHPIQYAFRARGDFFTSLVICGLFVAMSFTANQMGLGWRNHVMAVGQGLTAWSSLMLAMAAVQVLPGTGRLYFPLGEARGFVYAAAICWIIIQLWNPEPERQPISPDLQQYILALHKRVEYDLRRLDAGS